MGLIIICILVIGLSRYGDLQRLDDLIFKVLFALFAFIWLCLC
jgi:hypothetical protein